MTIWGQALYLSATIHSTLGCGVGGHEQVDRSSYKRREKNHRSHRHSGGETDHANIKSLSRAICSNFQNGDWFAPRPAFATLPASVSLSANGSGLERL